MYLDNIAADESRGLYHDAGVLTLRALALPVTGGIPLSLLALAAPTILAIRLPVPYSASACASYTLVDVKGLSHEAHSRQIELAFGSILLESKTWKDPKLS